MLDENGLDYVKITLASNLDEYKIKEMVDKNVPADAFIVATEGLTVSDSPKLETVFKISQLELPESIRYMAKLTPDKKSYPGIKNVYRKYSSDNKIESDTIGLDDERGLDGRPMLEPYIKGGKLIKKLPHLNEIRNYCLKSIKALPPHLLDLEKSHQYPVSISSGINLLLKDLRNKHLKDNKTKQQ